MSYAPQPPAGPQALATKVWVERQYPGAGTEYEDKNVEVRVFETTPAQVTAKAGTTINTGNYESIRIDIGVTLPCYPEEVPQALEFATEFISQKLMAETAGIRQAFGVQNGAKS